MPTSSKAAYAPYAPTLSLSTSYALEEYDGKARGNELLTADVSYLKRLSPAWFLTLVPTSSKAVQILFEVDPIIASFGYAPDRQLPLEIYDYDSNSVYADLEYAFENAMLLNVGFRRVNGFTVSSTTTPTLALYNVAESLYSEPAFKQGWVAYQLEADIN